MTEAQQLKLVTKRSMQQMYISQPSGSGADEGTGSKPGVPDVPTDESEEELSWNSMDDEGDEDDVNQEVVRDDDKDDEKGGDDEQESDEETKDEKSFDPIPQTPEDSEDECNGEEDLDLNIGEEERHYEEEEEDELYRDVNINQGRGIQATLAVEDSHVTLTPVHPDGQQESSSVSSQFMTSMLNQTLDVGMESIFETPSRMDVPTPTSVAPLLITTPTMTSSTIATTTPTSQAPILPTTIPSDIIQHLPSFGSLFCFDDRLRSLEENFSEFRQTNQFVGAAVNEQLEAEVLTRSSHSSRTSYAVAADLSEMELKKILIEKIKGNKSIQCSDEQRNLYKALVDAFESDKIILDTYGETVTLKRRRDDDVDKDEEPSDGPDRGSKRRREGKEPESVSAPTETATRSVGRSTQGSKFRQASVSESALAEEPMQTTSQIEEPSHPEFDTGADDQPIVTSSQHPKWFPPQQKPPTLDCNWNKTLPAVYRSIQPWISELAKHAGSRSSFNELMDTPQNFSNFLMNRLRVDTLTPELLTGPTYELMKGSCKSLIELEYHLEEVYKAIIDQLDRVNPKGMESIFETTSRMDVPTPTFVAPLFITTPTMTSSTIATTTPTSQASILPTTIPSDIIQHLPSFGSLFCFDDRLRSLEENFFEFRQTNQFVRAVSSIPRIVNHYMDQRMNEAVRVAVQTQSDRLRDETQRENDEFLRTVDENIKKIIKEQVKEQVKAQVSKILPRMEQAVNEQLEAETHTERLSFSTDDEMMMMIRMKNLPLDQTGGQRDAEKVRSQSQQALQQKLQPGALADDQPIVQSSRHPEWFSQQQKPPTPNRAWNKTLPAVHGSIQPWISELAKQADTRSSFNELMDTLLDFSNFLMNRLRVDTLTPELLAGPTYELMKGSCKSLIELEYHMEEDEEPSAGPDWGSKRRREGKEPESASALTKTTTRSAGRSTQGSRSRKALASKSALAEEPMQTTS
nr:hypothetical protein [Tanacetum cinerariifolium]